MITRAEAELDAKHEADEKRIKEERDEMIAEPSSLYVALAPWTHNGKIFMDAEVLNLYDLIGQLCAQGATLDSYPVEPLLNEQILETVDELSKLVETMVEDYLNEA